MAHIRLFVENLWKKVVDLPGPLSYSARTCTFFGVRRWCRIRSQKQLWVIAVSIKWSNDRESVFLSGLTEA